jgi:hypothetical protein
MNASSLLTRRVFSLFVLVAGFLLFFGVMTQFSWDGLTTFYITAFTLGLCGLPTTFAGVVIWVSACKLLRFPDTPIYWGGVIVIGACYVLHWLYIAFRTQQSDDT